MKKFVSYCFSLICSIIAISGAVIVITIIVLFIRFGVTPSKIKLEKELQKNEEHFINLVEFFETCGYENLWVHIDTKDTIVAYSSGIGIITFDEDIIKQFEYLLYELKYRCAKKKTIIYFLCVGMI